MTENIQYKNTSIGNIPQDWEVKKLIDLGDISSGGTPSTTIEKYWNGDINWCTPTDISALNSEYINDTNKKISEEGLRNSSAKILPPFSIIVCTRATIGKAAINLKPMSTNQGFKNIIPRNVDYKFLYYKILFEENGLKSIANGSTFLEVSKTDFENYQILLPPLPEQQAIAQLLSTWDTAIHKTEALLSQKELRKKWLMQQLLTGKKRLEGFEKSIWDIRPLSNFIKLIVREVPKPNEPYLGIGLRSHGKGTFLKHDEQPEGNSMDKFYVVRPNDLIVNITFAWEQAIAIVKLEDDGAHASHRFPTYTFIEGKGQPDLFKFFIVQPRMKYMLELISPGGAGRNRVMNKSDFIKLEFLLPSFEEQTAIAQVLQTADKEIQLIKTKVEQLRAQKKGLMQQLLTGKRRMV